MAVLLLLGASAAAQMEAKFSLPKVKYTAGEPILLEYTVKNTGSRPVHMTAADPNTFCSGYRVEVERVDAPRHADCGGGLASVDCLSSALVVKPGESRTERYLVNGDKPLAVGRYRMVARREVETSEDEDYTHLRSGPKLNTSGDFEFEVTEADDAALRAALRPYFADLKSQDWMRSNLARHVVTELASGVVENEVLELANDKRDDSYLTVPALRRANTVATRKKLAEIAEGDGDRRDYAASALSEMGDRSYSPLLRKMAEKAIASGDANRAGGMIWSVARLDGDGAIPWLTGELKSSNATIRSRAVYALQLTESRRAVPLLIDMMGDPDPEIPVTAQAALVQLTHRAYDPRQIVPQDTAAAHSEWLQWWARNGESAPIYKFGEYCGNAAPLK